MTTVFSIKQATTLPAYTDTLLDQNGSVVNLTGATVKFHLSGVFSGNVVNATATIVSAVNGQVSYAWTSGDTAIPGLYSAEWAVTFSGGAQETFPLNGYRKIEILTDLSLGFPQLTTFNPIFNTILNGNRAPTSTDGRNGDLWVWPSASLWYGPKSGGAWPTAYSLAGAPSPQGAQRSGIVAATIAPLDASANTTTPLVNTGNVSQIAIYLTAGMVLTNINIVVGSTGSTGMTHSWFGLADSTGKQVVHTLDQVAGSYTANTVKTIALASTYTVPTSGNYYVLGSMAGTTLPFLVTATAPVGAATTMVLSGNSGVVSTTPGTDGVTSYTLPATQLAVPYLFFT